MRSASFLVAALVASVASAATITIQVGANTTANASLIFQPQEVHAQQGDIVVFNFTNGTYDVIQAAFASPCIPISDINPAINGFNSGPRPADNGSTRTTLPVTINDNFTAIWFYDNSTCFEGGVGVINANDSSTETLLGFARNAERLNGTATSSSVSPSATAPGSSGTNSGSSSGTSSSSAPSASSNPAERNAMLGSALALPFAALAVIFAL
ncbi:hypothetical protein EW026_g4245 [Hermanssonia centrifuga]|uniref:Extracellular serine-rich protein n=1 Tax=Hermanssonia centrifuga TaxID=98765 RepID=A0A4S4KHN9_9APHY|nr:hypothetical protein EW026_g4245 [Hermanssonia centrifuga]